MHRSNCADERLDARATAERLAAALCGRAAGRRSACCNDVRYRVRQLDESYGALLTRIGAVRRPERRDRRNVLYAVVAVDLGSASVARYEWDEVQPIPRWAVLSSALSCVGTWAGEHRLAASDRLLVRAHKGCQWPQLTGCCSESTDSRILVQRVTPYDYECSTARSQHALHSSSDTHSSSHSSNSRTLVLDRSPLSHRLPLALPACRPHRLCSTGPPHLSPRQRRLCPHQYCRPSGRRPLAGLWTS